MADPIDWKAFLKPDEAARLEEIRGEHRELVKERQRIYSRCRKRAEKARRSNAQR